MTRSGVGLLESSLQQVAEQVVIAPPTSYVVQRDQKQIGPPDTLQQLLTVCSPADGVAEWPGETGGWS
jgi:hypothetical protein